MNETESLLEEVINRKSVVKFAQLLNFLQDKWLYFYVIENNFNENNKNPVYIHTSDKDNPVHILTIKTEESNTGVLYTNKQKAIDSVESSCKIGQMKGVNALEMFTEIQDIDSIAIQGNCGNIQMNKAELMKLIKNA